MSHERVVSALIASGRSLVKCDPGDVEETALALTTELGHTLSHVRSDALGIVHLKYTEASGEKYHPIGESCSTLLPHTDSPFIESPPRVIGLGCVIPAENGGETTLVDGEALVRHLRLRPNILTMLTAFEVSISRAEVHGSFPVIAPNSSGRLDIRFRHGEGVTVVVPDEIRESYEVILDYISDVSNQETMMLQSGDLLILDNARMLHGRLAFDPSSTREYIRLWYSGSALELGARNLP